MPNLLQFSADAYLNEMGIATPFFPDESCPQGDCSLLDCDPIPGVDDDLEDVELFRDFMTFLAPPPRLRAGDVVLRSSRLFEQIGCAGCHVPALKTGPSEVAALNLQSFRPCSDFLLHDMGDLGDGIAGEGDGTGDADGSALGHPHHAHVPPRRTRDLDTSRRSWRARRAGAPRARDRFAALSADGKAKLLAYLGNL